eukprot:1182396-Alexandrium_andersonii.AAC.1
MPTASSVPETKAPGDDEEMPDATPADQGSLEPATAGPASADPVVADALEAKDEPMAADDSEESSSPPPILKTGDAQAAPPPSSTPCVKARSQPK